MKNKKLKEDFIKAVEYAKTYPNALPADIKLKFYAYYKIASKNFDRPGSKTPLVNAFKANALIQANNISREKAMKLYIALVEKELK